MQSVVPLAGTRIVSKNNALLIGGILLRYIDLKSLSARCPTDFWRVQPHNTQFSLLIGTLMLSHHFRTTLTNFSNQLNFVTADQSAAIDYITTRT